MRPTWNQLVRWPSVVPGYASRMQVHWEAQVRFDTGGVETFGDVEVGLLMQKVADALDREVEKGVGTTATMSVTVMRMELPGDARRLTVVPEA